MLPKTAITAGSERVLAIATQMDAIGVKLNTRITAASSTVNVASAQSAYTDYVAKVADAKVQANAAAALVVNLTPDNGDKTLFASNSAALKAAAADLKTAQADLKAARADIATILKAIKGTEVKAHVEASSTTQVR
jgi:seryl-tRNA synthetase